MWCCGVGCDKVTTKKAKQVAKVPEETKVLKEAAKKPRRDVAKDPEETKVLKEAAKKPRRDAPSRTAGARPSSRLVPHPHRLLVSVNAKYLLAIAGRGGRHRGWMMKQSGAWMFVPRPGTDRQDIVVTAPT
ncbi:uncharacterized protein LOC122264831 [Penaeus japonicus]|uniref:uncharacterized protein LOC122264831 n=1 Tax=Penaeus japonicus TaxID=27405 RepID=UPI001C70D88D|nr:uncharacterized protein LOC122264831 [Penaeus japonicus]